jgi:hypothetical protein
MTYRIPENRIPKMIQYSSDNLGDFKETFNLDMSKKLGSILTTRTRPNKETTSPANAFTYFDSTYFTVAGEYLERGGNAPDDSFSNVTGGNHPSDIDYQTADLEEFNGFLYVSGTGNGDGIHKYSGSSWTVVSASGLTGSTKIHLMKKFADKIFIVDNQIIGHVTVADALNLSGTATFDTKLSAEWVCTMLEVSFDSLFIGYHNTQTNKGIIYEWDGATENSPSRKFEINSGILAGTVLDNIPYYVDVRGRMFRYAGTSFILVGAVGVDTDFSFDGVADQDIENRPVHPNGLISTDDGTILMLWKSGLSNRSDGTSNSWDDKPSGVYEYHPEIGLYHKYSISNEEGFGDLRIHQVGAIFERKPNTSPRENGSLLIGVSRFNSGDVTDISNYIYYNDLENTWSKGGYFVTKDIWSSNIEETWQKVYAKHKKLINSADSVVVKYRTEEHERTEATCSWSDENRLLTNTDLSQYAQGDEITVIIGSGSGKTAHIVNIESLGGGYSVLLDRTFIGVTGTCVVYFDKWIKAGISNDTKQYTVATTSQKNISPYIEIKVCLESESKSIDFNSLLIIHKTNINE